jgi:hypothetical protein
VAAEELVFPLAAVQAGEQEQVAALRLDVNDVNLDRSRFHANIEVLAVAVGSHVNRQRTGRRAPAGPPENRARPLQPNTGANGLKIPLNHLRIHDFLPENVLSSNGAHPGRAGGMKATGQTLMHRPLPPDRRQKPRHTVE